VGVKIIEEKREFLYKYSSSHQKSAATIREEKRVFVSILANQERNTKISRTHPRLRVYN
jgi:hypothetical protein